MASKSNKINHFMHPEHPLAELESHAEFLCNGCMMLGSGKRVRCSTCDFDLHQHCATCPRTLYSFLHPEHQLGLVFLSRPRGTHQIEHVCNVCCGRVEGLFYRCNACDFDVHPGCTRLPQQLSHVMHPEHRLVLQVLSSGWCLVCRNACTGWRYRCNLCSVDIHFPCLLVSCQGFTTSSRAWPYHGTVPSTYHPMNTTTHHYNPLYIGGSVPYPYPYPYPCPCPAPGFLNGINVRRMMYGIVGRLMEGAIANVLFGGPDFSLFFS